MRLLFVLIWIGPCLIGQMKGRVLGEMTWRQAETARDLVVDIRVGEATLATRAEGEIITKAIVEGMLAGIETLRAIPPK